MIDELLIRKALASEVKNVHNPRCFSVLLPLIALKEGYGLLYEVRSQNISQGGEVSFPGGRVEKGESAYESALRETKEELGIKIEDILPLGQSDYYENESIRIDAFVAILKNSAWQNYPFAKNEVSSLFVVPLTELLALESKSYELKGKIDKGLNPSFPFAKIPQGEDYHWKGMNKRILFYDLGEDRPMIWGLTAILTEGFLKKIRQYSLI